MILSKNAISKALEANKLNIQPFDIKNLKEASYTFTLSDKIKSGNQELLIGEDGYILKPGEFALVYSEEELDLRNNYCCILSARGSVAQAGINVLLGSNFCEPDTNGRITIEIHNTSTQDYKLEKGMAIMKGVFTELLP